LIEVGLLWLSMARFEGCCKCTRSWQVPELVDAVIALTVIEGIALTLYFRATGRS
jgi:hypothetical protein